MEYPILQFRVQAHRFLRKYQPRRYLEYIPLASPNIFFGVGFRHFVAVSWWSYCFLLNITKKDFVLRHYNGNFALKGN